MTQQEAFYKLDSVRDEFQAARFALSQILIFYAAEAQTYKSGLQQHVTLHHLDACSENLEITYLVRLFAEFEDNLRDYWRHGRKRKSKPNMTLLMDSTAAYCFMNSDDVDQAHEVREYRNDVFHERRHDPRFDFQTCRSKLACFVRWLPRQW